MRLGDFTTEGDKVLLSLALGSKESYDAWLSFLRDLVSRGLPVPLTITSDGAPGLLRAIDEIWPKSWRIRCWGTSHAQLQIEGARSSLAQRLRLISMPFETLQHAKREKPPHEMC